MLVIEKYGLNLAERELSPRKIGSGIGAGLVQEM